MKSSLFHSPRWTTGFVVLPVVLALSAPAQSNYATPYYFTTLAGNPSSHGSTDGTGSAARFYSPFGVAVDNSGNIFVADSDNHVIRKTTAAGVVTTLAGLAGSSGSADGTGSAARFNHPEGVAVDGAGNVFVADTYNSTIRKITSSGAVTTLAGSPGQSDSTDGTGSAARFDWPCSVAVDYQGNLYVADTGNSTIRKITSAGVVTTFAGTSYHSLILDPATWADGQGRAARFFLPFGVATDSAGNVYVADGNYTIRKITGSGLVATLAGLAGKTGSADGTGSAARFDHPGGLAVDTSGNVFVADTYNRVIRQISPGGAVTTLAGLAGSSGATDGIGNAARFDGPASIAVDIAGDLYVADANNSTLRWGYANPSATGSNYYVNSNTGSNSNTGTSATSPWLDFTNINSRTFAPGDTIHLACGSSWNQELVLNGSGSTGAMITLTSYGTGAKPKIRGNSTPSSNPVRMAANPSYWLVSNLEISNANTGIYIGYDTFGNRSLVFDNLYIHDILDSGFVINPTNNTGLLPTAAQYVYSGITISHCEMGSITNCPIFFNQDDGAGNHCPYSFRNVVLKNNYFHDYGLEIALTSISDGLMLNNICRRMATMYPPTGTAGFLSFSTEGLRYINNYFDTVPDIGTTDECAIDLEAFNNKTEVRGNFFYNTAGNAIEILFYADGIFQSGIPDYNTNIVIVGNTFRNCANGGSKANGWGRFVISTFSGRPTDPYNQTGIVADNLTFDEPSGFSFLGGNGSWSGFAQSNNLTISTGSVYNSADGYSGTQGANNWSYQSYDGSTWSSLPYDSTNQRWGSASAHVSQFNILPATTNNNWVARTWTAPATGTVSIRGCVLKDDITGGNGVQAEITKNGSVIWPTSGTAQTIAYNDQSGIDTNLDAISVSAGDTLRFQVNNNGSGNNTGDLTSWMPTVAYTNAPTITAQPQSQTVAPGASVQFSVTASGVPAPSYQWYFNGNPYSGATTSSLGFTNARSTDAGDYTVVVTNEHGSVTSAKATLTLSAATTPTTGSSAASGGGGGGAPSLWFGLTLLTLLSARLLHRSDRTSSDAESTPVAV